MAVSHFVLAAAHMICKTKPEALSVRDYILELRKHINRDGGRDIPAYFDTAAYYRSLYQRTELEKSMLKVRLSDLQQEVDRLKGQHGGSEIVADLDRRKKRKLGSKDAVDNGSADKRVKSTIESSFLPKGNGSQNSNVKFMKTDAQGDIAALQFYQINKLLARDIVDVQAFQQAIFQASQQIPLVVADFCQRLLHDEEKPGSQGTNQPRSKSSNPTALTKGSTDSEGHLLAIARLYTSLLNGMSKLGIHDDGKRYLGAIIYACVSSFKAILDQLCSIAKLMAANTDATTDISQPSKNKTSKGAKEKLQQSLLRCIATLLNSILLHLNVGDLVHRQLFEGFTFVIFERVAHLMYQVTFGHTRCNNIENDISKYADGQKRRDGDRAKTDLESKAFSIEAPLLIPLFERCASLASSHFAPHPSLRATRAKSTKGGAKPTSRAPAYVGKTALSMHIRERLQQTLVNCMFGADDKSKDDFMDCLRMPMRLAPLPAPKFAQQEQDTRKWLVKEAWRILGWEILQKELEG